MPLNSQVILPSNSHTGDGTERTVTGDPVKGDGYYGRSDGLHSIQITTTDLTGTVSIQATLAVDPAEEDWFTVYTQTYVGDSSSDIVAITGNYVWLRGILTYTDGTLTSVLSKH